MLSKNIRTHILLLRDWNKINITTEQYQALRLQKEDKKRNDMVTIRDTDTKEVLFDWEYWDIKWFIERKQENINWYKKVCQFWTRHNLQEECQCNKKFWCLSIVFQDKLKEIWIEVYHHSDITPTIQQRYLNHINSKINVYKDE
jgi:hypothetical protein